jgi:DNA polymerase IV
MDRKQRYIVHVDMDAFFASVEQRDNPDYQGKPVIVGADPRNGKGRGVVAACSYEARKFGIHSAMPISTAYKKCPGAVFLRPDMARYAEASHSIFDIFQDFTPDVEPISIDEAFLDITGSHHLFGSPEKTCLLIKNAIKEKTGLTASVGMAPNKMTAKIASDIKKPDGFVVVSPEKLLDFLHPLSVKKLWGVGERTAAELAGMGIHTIGDLAAKGRNGLYDAFGKNGTHAWELANGIDDRDVEPAREAISISNEYTFEQDTRDMVLIMDILMHLSEKVSRRMRREDLKARTITLKIRSGDFKTYTRSVTIDPATNFADRIYRHVLEKAESFELGKMPVRLLGVKVSALEEMSLNTDLFPEGTLVDTKKERIHKAIDRIAEKYGENVIRRRC